ncbi:MAG: VanW family protein [Fimbriimonadaceae bacterium]
MAGKQKPRKTAKRSRAWRVIGICSLGLVVFGGIYAAQYEPKAPEGTKVWGMDIGGMDRAEVRAMVEKKWGEMSLQEVTFYHEEKPFGAPHKVADLGLTLQIEETLSQVHFRDALETANSLLSREQATPADIAPELAMEGEKLDPLAKSVREALGKSTPASVRLVGGNVKRTPEDAGFELDVEGMLDSLSHSLDSGGVAELPLRPAPVKITEDLLAKIDGSIGSFTTSFSEGNRPRSNNIRVAAGKIDGTIILPGEKFSFNGHLGQRTQSKGYQVAGVYVSGRHDFDVGGGICQVSTTLFNAALLSGLDFSDRSPHSLPVPYVPRGRDAAVSYPQPDLVLTNPYEFPIALSTSVARGKITFHVLGTKSSKPKVTISQQTVSSWSRGVKYVEDKSLAPGTSRVEDKGGSASRAVTTRTVTSAAGESKKQTFESTYSGGPSIVRRNSSAKPAAKPQAPAEKPAAPPPPVTPAGDPASGADGL